MRYDVSVIGLYILDVLGRPVTRIPDRGNVEFIEEISDKLWLQILRAQVDDPMRQSTITASRDDGLIYYPNNRRVGRPRKDWKEEAVQRMWDKIAKTENTVRQRYDNDNPHY